MRALSINDLLHERRFEAAVARMQEACRVYDPTEPVDVEAVRRTYEQRKAELRAVVPAEPFPARVVFFGSVKQGGAR